MQNVTATITKLRALSASDNPHEAATAARIADKLSAQQQKPAPKRAPGCPRVREVLTSDARPTGNSIKSATRRGTRTLIIDCANGNHLEYNEVVEPRIVEVVDGKAFTTTEEAAVELASEMRAMGVTEARAFGYAVVFWG